MPARPVRMPAMRMAVIVMAIIVMAIIVMPVIVMIVVVAMVVVVMQVGVGVQVGHGLAIWSWPILASATRPLQGRIPWRTGAPLRMSPPC